MNHKFLSIISLLSLLVANNVLAMEEPIEKIIEIPRSMMEPLRTFFKNYDYKKYYASHSPEINEILPTVKIIIDKADVEQNSRKEDALAVVADGSFDIKDASIDNSPSLAVVKRYGLKTNAINTTLFAESDIKEYVLTFKQVDILRDIKYKMTSLLNVTETLFGNPTNKKDLVDALNKLDGIHKTHGITMKVHSSDYPFEGT
jgi:hypothetical protein